MIPVDLSLHYSNIKVTVTCELQRSQVKRRVCLIGFRWQVRKRLINMHDKALGAGEGVRTVLSLDVTGFWGMTPHTLAQIYRRFGRTCWRHPNL